MGPDSPEQSDRALRKLVELRWQREVIQRWVHCSVIAAESQEQLQEMLSEVDIELRALEAAWKMDKPIAILRKAG